MKQSVLPVWIRIISLTLLILLCTHTQAAGKLFPFANNSANQETAQQDDPLPPEQAFALTSPLYDGKQLLLRWELPEAKFYLYKEKFKSSSINARS